ncbi:hypothetical protein SD70_11855 [Gordoniibacillus kamchatkensis]|uniref:Methyl-accepting chemotaxis protein n=1 Tax=Gordoniibacillus kamchatkensis TaxID=1590651 RepID=A0ABR5AK72_9BACL|nr:hypothetical protein [Paenibacillus sp. VKM B-2647]KIL40752.1 hypothetical protein SD70_11855 [Paenibacillus sp. VKM B-2647]
MKWMTDFIAKSTLRKRIMVSSLLCLVVPAAGIMMISSAFTTKLIQDRAENTASESLQVAQAYITNNMNNLIRITNNIQFDTEMVAVLKNPSQGNKGILEQLSIQKKLDQLTSDKPGVYVSILLSEGGYYSNYSNYDYNPNQFRREAWFAQMDRLDTFETYWIGVQLRISSRRRRQAHT